MLIAVIFAHGSEAAVLGTTDSTNKPDATNKPEVIGTSDRAKNPGIGDSGQVGIAGSRDAARCKKGSATENLAMEVLRRETQEAKAKREPRLGKYVCKTKGSTGNGPGNKKKVLCVEF